MRDYWHHAVVIGRRVPPDLSDFFGNLNMGDNDATAKYVILSSLFQFLLEFLLVLSVVDAVGLSCIDATCSSTLLVCVTSSSAVSLVMIYQLLARIISYGYLLIYSTFLRDGESRSFSK